MRYQLLMLVPLLISGGFLKGGINPDAPVAELTIFAYAGNSPLSPYNIDELDNSDDNNQTRSNWTGHVFLQVKNISGSYLQVGHLNIGNNTSLLISCWPSLNGYPSSGIWYNRECFDLCGWETKERVSLTTNIDSTGLTALNSYVTSSSNNYYDLITHDCSIVSTTIWNSAVGNNPSLTVSVNYIPYYVKESIKTKSGYSTSTSYTWHTTCGYVSSSNTYVTYI